MKAVAAKFFLPYQQRWIRDNSRLKLMEKSRQIGVSFSTAYRAVATTAAQANTFDTWVSSRDDLQAQLFGKDCEAWARILHLAAGDLATRIIDDKEHITAHVLPFANGRAVNSMSSNPNAQAGKRGARILDEFALHPDPRKLYSIAYPGVLWGGTMELISTHRGSQNFFNELVNEIKHAGNPKGISLHTVTILDAVAQGLLGKLKAKWATEDPRQQWTDDDFLQSLRNGCADEESWQQEFLCNPADDNSAFLSYDLIASCEYGPLENWASDLADVKNPLYIGVDVGRKHDLTVIWVVERAGDVNYTRRIVELTNETFDAQEHALYSILQLPQVRRCCIDETGIGRQFAERAQQRFGQYKVEGVTFTAGTKEELAYPLRAAFEDRTVRLPNAPLIRSDLRAVKKETSASGNIRFTADRGVNGHSDRFWALALALHAAKPAFTNYSAQLV
jgi:phage FluMu gp28-like protein